MCINRFTKIVFSIAFVITAQQFFGMDPKPAVCAAAPIDPAYYQRISFFAPALTDAVKYGDLPKVQQLLKNPIDPKAPQIALILATYYQQLDIIKFLIEDLHVDVGTQLISLDENYQVDAMEFLAHCSEQTPLRIAASKGNFAIATYLIEKGANVNAQDIHGWSALHLAVIAKNFINDTTELVTFLINSGAEVNQKNNQGVTPLFLAVYKRDLGLVKLLLENHADVNTKEGDCGRSALLTAVRNNSLEIVKLLLANDAIVVNEKHFSTGLTALHEAVSNTNLTIIKHLVANGADLYAKLMDMHTALGLAKITRNREVIEYLASAMPTQTIKYALLACDEIIEPVKDTLPTLRREFPPEDIDRILKPCIAAALRGE